MTGHERKRSGWYAGGVRLPAVEWCGVKLIEVERKRFAGTQVEGQVVLPEGAAREEKLRERGERLGLGLVRVERD